MRDLENHMVLGDPPGWRDRTSPDKCVVCGDKDIDMWQYGLDFYCSSCTRKCLWCEDFMRTEDGVQLTDGCMHKECHEDWKRENNGAQDN